MKISDLVGKKIAVLGLGIENLYLCDFLLKNEIYKNEVRDQKNLLEIEETFTFEEKKILGSIKSKLLFVTGKGYLSGLDDFDYIFRTPGISSLLPEIISAKKNRVIVSSQIQLFFDLCPAKIIGVTGTKGKGTTASLIAKILEKNFSPEKKIFLLGNIGQSAIDKIWQIDKDDLVVLELSSFQLQDLITSPKISVVTNLSEDHLNYHKSLSEYYDAKTNIIRYQSKLDFAVINQDYLTAFEMISQTDSNVFLFSGKNYVDKGAFVREISDKLYELVLRFSGREEVVCRSDELKIVGRHNLENIAAASIVAKILNVKTAVISRTIREFEGLAHRIEYVGTIDKAQFYNDSFATNPLSTISALESFAEPIILIVGGSLKNSDYQPLVKKIVEQKNVKKVIYFGQSGEIINHKLLAMGFKKSVFGGRKIDKVIDLAKNLSKPGDIVLFSPASASFGMFKNYKDRGDKFRLEIQKNL